MPEEKAHCPECGVKTVPDHQDLTYEMMLCDLCSSQQEPETQ